MIGNCSNVICNRFSRVCPYFLLVFEESGPDHYDDLDLQFEAVSHMPEDERRNIKALLEDMIMKYQTRKWLAKS